MQSIVEFMYLLQSKQQMPLESIQRLLFAFNIPYLVTSLEILPLHAIYRQVN